jgi:hypothetical protein
MVTKMWYCQPDGGQWNVPVELHEVVDVHGEMIGVISGKKLIAPVEANGLAVLAVPLKTLFHVAQ